MTQRQMSEAIEAGEVELWTTAAREGGFREELSEALPGFAEAMVWPAG